ncbi:methionine ABC transporter permease [Agrococcus sp. ARC_14]|uniref:methionine ABC transporter permease n=1 Tax=Agrococcus sp. ARC_14 TaxID=2919927 RepID=UPI001F0660AF|nr:methionine ABC transporter permease [Agrococcus sp. ARC_14]MCH1881891.1 ABC transporter permease [Agrococcus sp. ARC_14]
MIDPTAPDFWSNLIQVLLEGTWETVYMTAIAMAITFVVGLPLGIILVGTEQGRFLEAPLGSRALGRVLNAVLGFIVNLGRSVPFIVLMIALIPLTRWLLGSFIGTGPAIVPLTLVAIPFFVRVVEIAVREVDPGLFEAADSLGASRWLLVRRVLLPQATPAILLGTATTITSIINFSAMVGVVGGGGLGNVALTYGMQRYSWIHIVGVVIILFLLVQVIQWALTALAKRLGAPVTKRGAQKGVADAQAHLDADVARDAQGEIDRNVPRGA